ncbi:hypothetical protein K678_11351 [Magnetospirillum fulvum MGU-K5]|uniref:Uncharacterized protein n=1 Tax=Magnetospirillum fulvum MGU-K5 TaxID=1316936 RepID=S9TS58_MAGFU|nr:hypothetical protein K678_11351 [Magnetospirillum fulvum MGU-K5]
MRARQVQWLGPRRIGQQVNPVSVTGTASETNLYTADGPAGLLIPANMLGRDGDRLRISLWGSFTASTNIRTIRVRLGGVQMAVMTVATANAGYVAELSILRCGTGQVRSSGGVVGGVGLTTGTTGLYALDLSADQRLTVTGQLTSAGETISIDALAIILEPGK